MKPAAPAAITASRIKASVLLETTPTRAPELTMTAQTDMTVHRARAGAQPVLPANWREDQPPSRLPTSAIKKGNATQ